MELFPQLHIDTIFFSWNRLYAHKYIQSEFSKQVQKNLGNAKENNEFLKSNLSAHGVGTEDIFVCTKRQAYKSSLNNISELAVSVLDTEIRREWSDLGSIEIDVLLDPVIGYFEMYLCFEFLELDIWDQ